MASSLEREQKDLYRCRVEHSEYAPVERVLAQSIADSTRAVWGFQNRTDFVTLTSGDQVVLQRYRHRQDAQRRVQVMQGLWEPAAESGIIIPRIREFDLDADPAWIIFDVLPGVPVPAAGEVALGGPGFPAMARLMGELLTAFRRLPTAGLQVDDLWADPGRLAAHGTRWAQEIPALAAVDRAPLDRLLRGFPSLFANRPVVLAHGDFAPMNVLTDGALMTGLLDFESVRLADPLFDVAWWAWSVSFAAPAVLEAAWPEFLAGAAIDPTDPDLPDRIHSLQVLRMLELLADETRLSPEIRGVVTDRLLSMLR